MNCKNCMGSCIHSKMKDIYKPYEWKDDNGNVIGRGVEHVGYEHYCDNDPQAWKEWHKRNENNTYEVYKNDSLPCYEPTEFAKATDGMINTMNKILDKINKKS